VTSVWANTGTGDTTNLVATLLATGGILSPSGPQTYGVPAPTALPVAQPFLYREWNLRRHQHRRAQLQDGTGGIWERFTFSFVLGQPVSRPSSLRTSTASRPRPCRQGGRLRPAGAEINWVTVASHSDAAPNSAFSPDSSGVGVNELDSPAITLPAAPAQLTFPAGLQPGDGLRRWRAGESIGGGAWTTSWRRVAALSSGGYIHPWAAPTITLCPPQAWSGISGWVITTAVNLPAAASGQTIQLRWRCGSDDSVGAPGWTLTRSQSHQRLRVLRPEHHLGVTPPLHPDPGPRRTDPELHAAVTNLGPASRVELTLTDTLPA